MTANTSLRTFLFALTVPALALGCADYDDDFRAIPVETGTDGGEEGDGDGDPETGEEEDTGESETGDEERPCEPLNAPLMTEDNQEVGLVTIVNDDEMVRVNVEAKAPFLINGVDLYLGFNPVPLNDFGHADIGLFNYHFELEEPMAWFETSVMLEDIGLECGGTLVAAAYADLVVHEPGCREVVHTEAWARPSLDSDPCDHELIYDICCEPDPERPCPDTGHAPVE